MVKNKKTKGKIVIRTGVPVLVVCLIAVIILLFIYMPSLREAFILATTVKPENLTELYFEDHLSLPGQITLFEENSFKFTIHNLENKDMEYLYEVYIDENGEKQEIEKKSVSIKNDGYKTITIDFTISDPIQRARVVVGLISKDQQISFWIEE